jgi:hypothetical protein
MKGGVFTFPDGMGTIGIGHHGKGFIGRHQCIDKSFRVLVMDIIVAGAVNQQQVPFELLS